MIKLNSTIGSVTFYVNPNHIICFYEDEHEGQDCTLILLLHPLPDEHTTLAVSDTPDEICQKIYQSQFGDVT